MVDDSDQTCNLRNLYDLYLDYDDALECEEDSEYEDEEDYDDMFDYDEENFFENEVINDKDPYYIIEEGVEDYPEFDDWD